MIVKLYFFIGNLLNYLRYKFHLHIASPIKHHILRHFFAIGNAVITVAAAILNLLLNAKKKMHSDAIIYRADGSKEDLARFLLVATKRHWINSFNHLNIVLLANSDAAAAPYFSLSRCLGTRVSMHICMDERAMPAILASLLPKQAPTVFSTAEDAAKGESNPPTIPHIYRVESYTFFRTLDCQAKYCVLSPRIAWLKEAQHAAERVSEKHPGWIFLVAGAAAADLPAQDRRFHSLSHSGLNLLTQMAVVAEADAFIGEADAFSVVSRHTGKPAALLESGDVDSIANALESILSVEC
jgi:hypothetical protein